MGVPDDETNKIQLTRIEGKLDVTNERLSNVQSDIVEIRVTQRDHGSRLGLLEAKENMRHGFNIAGKVAWAAIGTIFGGGGIAAAMKLFGI
jgi:hypothetical protein